ncbi:2-amino-4-hydroxy-6-hydroxymethyldihydropteridine diphosphokinase [Bowdeniella massiliensis]|uniref:2-amino-4-hydroxy-6- hydroxymethyldihydropteridine diphosphokinase n=1 Tax=Bowdeniella massiliensis TaxID=2932264 RepID=UPI002028BA26|nr:2-amino-4-hydroxy-6-hydroxymethyldihydropteridine diphosphokinase [Bowdeniella massiliensis]
MPDVITLTGITAHAYHGVFAAEKQAGQTFIADIAYQLDTRAAARGDDLAETVSYAEVAEAVAEGLQTGSLDLIETLAENLARIVLGFEGVDEVRVSVHKPEAPIDVPFSDVCLTITRTRASLVPAGAREVVFSLGANLGNPIAQLRAAVDLLRAELSDVEVGPLLRTAPVLAPGQRPQPDYYNTVVIARSRYAATELLALANRIEDALGRVRTETWGERTLDIDIVDIARYCSCDPALTIPHPRARDRAFVLVPYAALRPHATLAGHQLSDLLAAATGEVYERIEDWL